MAADPVVIGGPQKRSGFDGRTTRFPCRGKDLASHDAPLLTIGRHQPAARHAQRSHQAYGMEVTLLARARVKVSSGRWAARCFEFKSDARSGAERLAGSRLSLRVRSTTGTRPAYLGN